MFAGCAIFVMGHRFERLNVIQMQKQTEQLLNADDLDTMWVCLRENCVVDDATGAEKVCTFFWIR